MDRTIYQPLISKLFEESKTRYGARLVTFAIFGSYARNDMRPDSDLDILIIAEGLPKGRMNRSDEFHGVRRKLEGMMKELARENLHPYFSPIFKTPEEAKRRSLLYLDMTEEIEILYDQGNFFRKILDGMKERLKELGSKRLWKGKMWYWVLKPDAKPGEVISL